MVWTETSILVADGEQKVTVLENETQKGIILTSLEVEDKTNFKLYLTPEEAIKLAEVLERYAIEINK